MLTLSQKRKIVEDTIKFNVSISVTDGSVVKKDSNNVWVNVDDDSKVYEDDEVVVAAYDKNIRKRIATYAKTLLSKRGIKDINSISSNDSEVKSIIKRMRLDNRSLGLGAEVDEGEIQAAIELVRDKYEGIYQTTVLQVIYWSILRDSMFIKDPKSSGILSRFDVNIPDDYWDDKWQDEAYNEIDEMIFAELPTPVKLRQNDSLEMMVAIATALVNTNENFAAKIGELSAVVFSSFALENEDYDDAGMFRTELVRILPNYVAKQNDVVNRGISGSRVFIAPKETGKSKSERTKEENIPAN